MKIKRTMLHKDLQPYYFATKAINFIMKRRWTVRIYNALFDHLLKGKEIGGIDCSEIYIPSSDGRNKIRTRIYKPHGIEEELPVMIYMHSGGYISGIPESNHKQIESFLFSRPCVVVAPDYRKALEEPFPAAFNDCYDTVLWLKENARQIHGKNDSFIIAGHSAGGGLAAAVTLKARDTEDFKIAFQMPIYPMIDDGQPADPSRFIESPVWDSNTNAFGWNTYLSKLQKEGQDIPVYAAPYRNKNYSNFPPTITMVGDMEPFYRETVDYVKALEKESIDVVFKVFKGCFHAFDIGFPNTKIGQEAIDFIKTGFSEFYDKYLSDK